MAATPTGLAPTPRPLPSQHTPVAHHVSQIARRRTETRVHVPGGGNPDPAVFPGPQHRDLAEPAPLVAVPADMQDHLRHCSVGTTSRTASGCRRFETATGCVSGSGFARQALIAACHEGPWWQLDDWHPRCDPRIPLINREPVAKCGCSPSQITQPLPLFFRRLLP